MSKSIFDRNKRNIEDFWFRKSIQGTTEARKRISWNERNLQAQGACPPCGFYTMRQLESEEQASLLMG